MKNVKSFLAKNFLVLAFAVGGIFAVTSNVTVSGNNNSEDQIGNPTIRYCMRGGGNIMAYARPCLDPGYPSLPQYKCGQRIMIWDGRNYEQCF